MGTVTTTSLAPLLEAGERFATIYADPPWRYENTATRAAAGGHYATMSVEEVCALPVRELAADEAHLHLWTTNAFLLDAFRVIEAWGFEYRSCLVWVKPGMGLGNYWRLSHEFLLLGVRGGLPFQCHDLRSWIEAPRAKHSAKPEHVRRIIERASPGPRLELFGRRVAEGWTVWGNEIEPSLFDPPQVVAL
jgi:N6-adenosine-specific RNA methylase IME4